MMSKLLANFQFVEQLDNLTFNNLGGCICFLGKTGILQVSQHFGMGEITN